MSDKVRGIANYENLSSDFNILSFIIENVVRGMVNTALPVTVSAVDADNLKVSVKPLIAQRDGENNSIAMPEIFDIPFFRYQAGTAALMITPQVDDIGVALFFQTDASGLQKGDNSVIPPRMLTPYPLFSAVYIGGIMQKEPETVIEITNDNITIKANKEVSIQCETASIKVDKNAAIECETASVKASDKVEIKGDNSALIASKEIKLGENASSALVRGDKLLDYLTQIITLIKTHTHEGVTPGSGSTATSTALSAGLQNPPTDMNSQVSKTE